jgi:cell division septation protein DedD
MASRRRGQESTGRAGRIIGWAFVLSLVFSAGLIVGLQLDGDPRAWLVSTAENEAEAASAEPDDSGDDQGTIFSFYEELSGGKPPEAATTKRAADDTSDASGDDANDNGPQTDKADSNTALYTVQVSAFPDLSKAEAELEALISKGMSPHVVAAPTNDSDIFYRLRIGRYNTIEAAESARKRLAERLDSEPVVTDF